MHKYLAYLGALLTGFFEQKYAKICTMHIYAKIAYFLLKKPVSKGCKFYNLQCIFMHIYAAYLCKICIKYAEMYKYTKICISNI